MSMTKIDELLKEVTLRTGYMHRYYHQSAAVMRNLSAEARSIIELNHGKNK